MSSKYDLNPRLYDQLISMVKNDEPLDPILARYSPQSVRDTLEQATAQAAQGKHPYDLFEKPELMRDVPINEIYDPNNYGSADYTIYKKSRLPVEGHPISINVNDKNDLATKIHEAQHVYDQRSQLYVPEPIAKSERNILSNIKQELEIPRNIKSVNDLKGLEETTAYYASHFKPDVEDKFGKLKQLLNLERVVKGQPLKMVAPVLKAAGIGALAASAAGIGQKAMAGDFTGAGTDAADLGTDFIPVVGEAKMVGRSVMPTDTGDAELPADVMQERDRFNNVTKRLLNK